MAPLLLHIAHSLYISPRWPGRVTYLLYVKLCLYLSRFFLDASHRPQIKAIMYIKRLISCTQSLSNHSEHLPPLASDVVCTVLHHSIWVRTVRITHTETVAGWPGDRALCV